MEKWTRGIWRKRRRGCSISGVQWWIDSGLEKPHLAGCFTHVQWCYAFQTSSVFLLSKGAAYCKCSQNVCQQRKKDTLLLCVCDLVAMCVACVLCVWTCFAKLSRTLGCIYTCTIYVWVTFLLLFVRFAWRFLLQLMSLGLWLLKLLIHTPSERCIPNIWFRPWKHYLVRHIFSFLSVLSSCFVLYHIKCWLMRLGAKNKYFSKCKDNKQLDTQQ